MEKTLRCWHPGPRQKIDMCKWYASTESLSSVARSHTPTSPAAPRSLSIWGRSRTFPHHEIPMKSRRHNFCATLARVIFAAVLLLTFFAASKMNAQMVTGAKMPEYAEAFGLTTAEQARSEEHTSELQSHLNLVC